MLNAIKAVRTKLSCDIISVLEDQKRREIVPKNAERPVDVETDLQYFAVGNDRCIGKFLMSVLE